MELISVVLPTHNGAERIGASMDSVLGQSERRLELIVVLDGCTDGTEEVARERAERDGRVRVVRLEKNRGLPGALNEGFARAGGDLWTWTSDDNEYGAEALERMAERLEASRADVVVAGMEIEWEGEGRVERYIPPAPERLRLESVAGACFLYRRRVDEVAGGYDEGERLAEDYGFFLRAWCRGCRFEVLPEVLYRYRMHDKSLTARYGEAVAEVRDAVILKHLREMPDETGRERAKAAVELAGRYNLRGRVWQAARCVGVAARYSPLVAAGALWGAGMARMRRLAGARGEGG